MSSVVGGVLGMGDLLAREAMVAAVVGRGNQSRRWAARSSRSTGRFRPRGAGRDDDGGVGMQSFEVDSSDGSDAVPPIRWGWFVALGALVAIVGVILLLSPFEAAATLALLIGFSLLVRGDRSCVVDARYLPKPWLGYVVGAIYLATAIVAIAWPGITLWALAVVTGVGLILGGVALLLIRRDVAKFGVGGLPIWGAILSIVAGVLTLVWPGATILVLSIVLGIRVLLAGIALLATGLVLRRLT